MAADGPAVVVGPDEASYRRGIRAWVTYDWANSAYTVVVVSAVLPVYFSSVAGATLPSPARATQVFSLVTSISLAVTAVLSPLLGAYSDLVAAKKRILVALVGVGAMTTGALWLVTEGDWVMALILFAISRVAFNVGNVLYDALLPAVARPADQDAVSARGFAFGYLGGGLVMAVGVGMIFGLGAELGARLTFLAVGVWWAVFTLPLVRHVPEAPPTRVGNERVGVIETVRATLGMLRSLGRMPDLRRFLVAYLVYNDAISVVVAVAALYGAELGFGTEELLLAVLLVQFTAGPYAVLFGRLATRGRANRGRIGVFLVANIVLVPLVGIALGLIGPAALVGRADDPFTASGGAVGQGPVDLAAVGGPSELVTIDAELVGADASVEALVVDDEVTLAYVGRDVVVTHATLPGGGELRVSVDGAVATDGDGEPLVVDGSADVARYGQEATAVVADAGRHTLTLDARGGPVTVHGLEVAPPPRDASLPVIFAVLVGIQLVAGLLALALGRQVAAWARRVDARRGIMLALVAYVVVAVWGFGLDTVVEFWALAWLVSVVQGGSQALSRSLYTTLVPPRRAGEFFGLFSILSKAASFLSPLLFVASVALFESSRPAVLALSVMFLFGIAMLSRVDPTAGRRLAARLDREAAATADGRGTP